jgi:hypothetical protein
VVDPANIFHGGKALVDDKMLLFMIKAFLAATYLLQTTLGPVNPFGWAESIVSLVTRIGKEQTELASSSQQLPQKPTQPIIKKDGNSKKNR